MLVNNRFWQDGAIEEIQTGKPGRDWMLLPQLELLRQVAIRTTVRSRKEKTDVLIKKEVTERGY